MQENTTFIRDDVLPSYWANRLQQLLSTYSDFILSQATATAVQILAGPDESAAICTIEGKWRFIEASISRAHPGGAAGTYDVFATCKANDVSNVPDPFTDATDYSFALAIVAHNATPPIVAGVVDHFRKVGECQWDGAQITRVTQLVGVAPPSTQLVTGDIKASFQTADHGGWVLYDGRRNLVRANFPADFVAMMDARVAAGVQPAGIDGAHFSIPDWTGRTIVGADPGRVVITINPFALGAAGGEERHLLSGAESGTNSHGTSTFQGRRNDVGGGGGGAVVAPRFELYPDGLNATFWGSTDNGRAADDPHNNMQPYRTANIFGFTGEGSVSGGDGGGGGGGVGAPNVVNVNYTLQVTDAQHVVEVDAAGAVVITVPTDADQPMVVGSLIEVARMGAGTVTLAPEGGVTLRSHSGLLAIGDQYGSVSLRKRAANDWHIVGDLA